MWYHEYSAEPNMRSGVMIPRSALLDFYKLPDSGYCSVYAFDAAAKFAIQAQKHSQGLGRFPVFSDRLWIDIDGADSSPQEVERVKVYTRELTRQFQALDYKFTVWDSGSKGFHIAVKIEPMFGIDVPHSQLVFVRDVLKVQCDFSLYQHARLLSNPGRLHPKTGRKKTKIFESNGGALLIVPLISAPLKSGIDSNSLTDSDLARIGFQRLSNFIQDVPLAGMRHSKMWSLSSGLLEAGMSKELVSGLLLYVNKFLPDPKPNDEVQRAVDQAEHQLGLK